MESIDELTAEEAELKAKINAALPPAKRTKTLPDKFEEKVNATVGGMHVADEAKRRYLAEVNAFGIYRSADTFKLGTYKRGYSPKALIDGVLERGSICMLAADSYVGKSYLALDWALSIATGTDWLGRKVDSGKVLYLAMEGVNTLEKRWIAWLAAHGKTVADVDNFTGYPKAVNLMDQDSLDMLAADIRAQEYDLVVVDMLGQSIGGFDESLTKDAQAYMTKIAELREANLGGSVLFLQHTKKGLPLEYRGNTSLYGSADIVWIMSKINPNVEGDPLRLLECTKYKADIRVAKPMNLQFVEVGGDSVLELAGTSDPDVVELLELCKAGEVIAADLARAIVDKTGQHLRTVTNRISAKVKAANGSRAW